MKSQLEQFHSIEDFKVLYPQVKLKFSNHKSFNFHKICKFHMLFVFQEECNGKRSRNPSTSSSYGLRIGGYRSRRASEGDDGASSSSRGGARSRGSSRHSSGGQDRKPAYRCAGNTESKSL